MKIVWALMLLLLLAGCHGAAAERRLNLGRDVEATKPQDEPRMRARLRGILLGDNGRPDPDPHYRAAAAQGLGNLGNADDLDALVEAMMGTYADENRMVRMEAAIAAGKLRYSGITDKRRKLALSRLTSRLAFERDGNARLIESDYLVRSAMINSLAALGHRDAASALHDIAVRMRADLANIDTLLFTGLGEEGLFDLCIEKLVELTSVSREAAEKDRASHDSVEEHLKWWADQIAKMPPVPLG